jgi:hypothetical protein
MGKTRERAGPSTVCNIGGGSRADGFRAEQGANRFDSHPRCHLGGTPGGHALPSVQGQERTGDGAAAEYVAVEARNVAPKPQTVDHVHAAAVPPAGPTAWQALFDHGKLAKGQTVVIHVRAVRSDQPRSSLPVGQVPK